VSNYLVHKLVVLYVVQQVCVRAVIKYSLSLIDRFTITTIQLVWSCISVHSFWTFEVRAKPPPRCMPANNSQGITPWFMKGPFQTLMVVTYSGLPFIIILVLNILIVFRLRCTPVAFHQSAANTRRHNVDDTVERCSLAPVSGLSVNGLQYGLVMSAGRSQSASSARSVQQVRHRLHIQSACIVVGAGNTEMLQNNVHFINKNLKRAFMNKINNNL